MKGCELCSYPAKMYCESDQASLCWECDEKVHSANFLVAKHTRSLLCQDCQRPTPWKASGPKLGTTLSVCENCFHNCDGQQERAVERDEESHGRNEEDEEDDDDIEEGEDDDDTEDAEYDDDDNEDHGQNQVVPWTSLPSPPPAASSSSIEEVSYSRFSAGESGTVSALKLMRDDGNFDSDDDIGGCCSRFNANVTSMAMNYDRASETEETTCLNSLTPLKVRRTAANDAIGPV